MSTASIPTQGFALWSTSMASPCFPCHLLLSTLHSSQGGPFANIEWITTLPCLKSSNPFHCPWIKSVPFITHPQEPASSVSSDPSCIHIPPSFTTLQPHWPSLYPSNRARSPTSCFLLGLLHDGFLILAQETFLTTMSKEPAITHHFLLHILLCFLLN